MQPVIIGDCLALIPRKLSRFSFPLFRLLWFSDRPPTH